MTKRIQTTEHRRQQTADPPKRAEHGLLNYERAARLLGVSRGTLENWVSSGLYGVPFIKVGRLVRFRRDSLERWLESRERGGTASAGSDRLQEVS